MYQLFLPFPDIVTNVLLMFDHFDCCVWLKVVVAVVVVVVRDQG